MGHGGFVYCTLSQQINVVFSEEHSQQISCPAPPPLIIAEQKMCVYSYNSASSETLWTGIKVKGCEVDGSGRELKRREKKIAGGVFLKMQGLI